jgi:hypothetical protein
MAHCYEGEPDLEEDVGVERGDYVESLSVYNAGSSGQWPAQDSVESIPRHSIIRRMLIGLSVRLNAKYGKMFSTQ